MNKTAIKNFAIEARRKLIASVIDKAGLLGITKDACTEPIEKGQGFEIYATSAGTKTTLTGDAIKHRRGLVEQINDKGFQNVIEEVAYTWFNRLIAVRFMEVNDYLPTRVRVLSSETEGKNEPDIVTQAPNVDLDFTAEEQERIIELKAKADTAATNELFQILFIKQCNKLGEILPELFEQTADYTELLLNISYINEDGVVRTLMTIPESDFNIKEGGQVEIIGWLYQYYNTEPKDEVFALLKKNVKITKERIPAATQLFTPDWIVRYMVQNSLGRLWLEGHPNDAMKSEWKYYLDEAEQEADVQVQLESIRAEYKNLNPEDIKIIDPCMGSGHILVYAFDVLMQIYESCGYTQRDAARLILEKNIYGFDIDHRAYELAYFALLMKARSFSRRILNEGVNLNISLSYALDTQHYAKVAANHVIDTANLDVDKNQLKNDIDYLLEINQNVTEHGSVVDVKPLDFDKLDIAIKALIDDGRIGDFNNLLLLVKQSRILAGKYDVVVTNPPYMGSKGMSAKLSEYVQKCYPNSKSDLFAVFIEHCGQMAKHNGFQAMITQHAWMFLSSYEKLREELIQKDIINMAHLGARAFEEIGGEVVQTTTFVLRSSNIKNYKATYARLVDYSSQQEKELALLSGENRYTTQKENFSKIPGMPIAYWVSENVIQAFEGKTLGDYATPVVGMFTTDNNTYLKLWWETNNKFIGFGFHSKEEAFASDKKYFPYNKGGGFRKWYGNAQYVVLYENAGANLKALVMKKYPYLKGNYDFVLKTNNPFFQDGITWSDVGTGDFACRYTDYGYMFDVKGSSMFPNKDSLKYIIGFLNTKFASYLMYVFNPTMSFQIGNIKALPLIISDSYKQSVDSYVENNIIISRSDWDSFETSWDFTIHPLIANKTSAGYVDTSMERWSGTIASAFNSWKTVTEEQFKQLKSNEEELNRIFIDIYGLQDELAPEIEEKDVTIRRADLERDIRSFVSYAVGCMFGRFSLDVEGLVYAGGDWDDSKYKNFLPDKDNVLPISDEEYFSDDIVNRFVEFVKTVYGAETLEENLDFIASALGNRGNTSRESIRNYFLKDFYKDHVKIYQKRPIYWLFDSGKEDGFKALIYMHRYDEDTVGRVRVDYLHKAQAAIENAIANCDVINTSSASAGDKAKAMKKKEKLVKQLAETRLYDQAIAHIAHQRIPLDLDDGVKVNYERFQGVEVASEGKKSVKIDLLAKI